MHDALSEASDVRMVLEGAVLHKEGGGMMATARYQISAFRTIVRFGITPPYWKLATVPGKHHNRQWFIIRRESSEWAQCQMDELARHKERVGMNWLTLLVQNHGAQHRTAGLRHRQRNPYGERYGADGRDIRINLSTCLRSNQQWHETIVEKAKGVAV